MPDHPRSSPRIPEGYELAAVPANLREHGEYRWIENGQVMHWILREKNSAEENGDG